MSDIGMTVGLIKALAPKPDPADIKQSVEDWLDDHPEATTTVEDGAITRAKLAAEVKDDFENVTGVKPITFSSGYVYTGASIGSKVNFPDDIKTSSGFNYAIVDVAEGDVFCINGTGQSNAYLWTFIDDEDTILTKALINTTGNNLIITAPENAAKLILNSTSAGLGFCCAGDPINNRISKTDIIGNGKRHKIVAGTIRNSGNGWEFIIDENHQADLNCNSVAIAQDGRLYIDYSGIGAKKVISFLCGPDEALAAQGYIMGASVGKTAAYIQIFQYAMQSASAKIQFVNVDENIEINMNNPFHVTSAEWNNTTKTLDIIHENISDDGNSGAPHVSIMPGYYGLYLPRIYSYSGTGVRVEFIDTTTRDKVQTPDTMMSIYFNRVGTLLKKNEIDAGTLVSPAGNIWFIGVFEV